MVNVFESFLEAVKQTVLAKLIIFIFADTIVIIVSEILTMFMDLDLIFYQINNLIIGL